MPSRAWVLGLLTCGMAVSCEGCPGSPTDPIPRELGTLNPLFDRAGFVDFPGAVIDPFSPRPTRFRAEMILPVRYASIAAESVRAYVVPASIGGGRFGQIVSPPPDIGTSPQPLTPVPVRRLDFERDSAGDVVALTATLDDDVITAHAGHDLIVQLDPTSWQFRAPVEDDVFRTPMRFTYRISSSGPDGDPPYLADLAAIAEGDLADAIGTTELAVTIAPHSPIRFVFSEPMYQVAPVLAPQDPVGFRPQLGSPGSPGFVELVSRTQAGLAPGQGYCISMVPPRMAALGPLAWGSQDLSGEPLVPFRPARAARAALAGKGDAVDVCFRAGPLRIEQPRPAARVGVAARPLAMQLIAAGQCGGKLCDDAFFRLMARARAQTTSSARSGGSTPSTDRRIPASRSRRRSCWCRASCGCPSISR